MPVPPDPRTAIATGQGTKKEDLEFEEQLLAAKKEGLRVEEQKLLVLERGTDEYRDQAVIVNSIKDVVQKQNDIITAINKKRKEQSAVLYEEILAAEALVERYESLGKSLDKNILKRKTKIEQAEKELEYYKHIEKFQRDLTAAEKERVENAKKLIQQLDKEVGRMQKVNKELKEGVKRTDKWSQKFDVLKDLVLDIYAAFKGGPKEGFKFIAMKGAAAIDTILLGGIQKAVGLIFQSIKKLLFTMDEVTKAFEVATGMGDKFNKGMVESWYALRDTGVGMEDLSKSTQSLIANTSDFSLAQTDAANRVRDTGALLTKVGVEADDYAKGIQNSMKMFGQSMIEGEQTALELLETAKALQVPPKQLAADFARVGGSLAKLGREGPQAFKELARTAKLTGMEIEKILQLTDKFDTFESAAEMTGKLNAALGGNFVNAMDMMMDTDPVSRFEKMRDAVSQTGLTFDDMSYYQRKFFTESMGLSDVGDLALMMSGNMDMMSGATQKNAAEYADLAAQAEENLNLQQRWDTILAKMAPMLMDIVGELHVFLEELKDNEQAFKDIAVAARTFMNFGMWVIQNMGTIIKSFVALRLAIVVLGIATKSASLALAGPVGLVAAIGLAAYAIVKPGSPSFLENVAVNLPAGFSAMGSSAKGASAELRKSGQAIGEVGRATQGGLRGLTATGDALAGIGQSMQGLDGPGSNLLSTFASIDIAMLEKTKELFEGIAAAIKSIPERQAVALAASVNQTVAGADALPAQKAMALTDAMDATAGAANAVQTTAFINAAKTPARERPQKALSAGGLLGTIKIDFNSELFKDRVITLSRSETGKIIVEAQHEAT